MSSETAMTPCRLPECSVPMEEGEWQLSSRHHLCQHSKQTHTWLQGNQAHIQPVRYLTLSAPILCRGKNEGASIGTKASASLQGRIRWLGILCIMEQRLIKHCRARLLI